MPSKGPRAPPDKHKGVRSTTAETRRAVLLLNPKGWAYGRPQSLSAEWGRKHSAGVCWLSRGSPAGSVVGSPPARAGAGLDPCSWKIPHAMQQLSPSASAIEPGLQSPGPQLLQPACPRVWALQRGAPAREQPPLPVTRKSQAAAKAQPSQQTSKTTGKRPTQCVSSYSWRPLPLPT